MALSALETGMAYFLQVKSWIFYKFQNVFILNNGVVESY
jgi:hypothetical protein